MFPEIVHAFVLPVVFIVLHWRRAHEQVQGQQLKALLVQWLSLGEKTRTQVRKLQIVSLFHSELITVLIFDD